MLALNEMHGHGTSLFQQSSGIGDIVAPCNAILLLSHKTAVFHVALLPDDDTGGAALGSRPGLWCMNIVLPNQQGPHLSLINKIQGETGNYSWSWLGYRMCWKESNICPLGTPGWHSFLIHFIAFSICRCRNCRQKTFDIMVSLPLVTGGWPPHQVHISSLAAFFTDLHDK